MDTPTTVRIDLRRRLPIIATFCMLAAVLAAVGLSAATASAAGHPLVCGNIDGHLQQGGDRVFLEGWPTGTDVTVEIWDSSAKTTLVDSGAGKTDINGSATIYFADLEAGQFVLVEAGGLTGDVELVSLTAAIDVFSDRVSGTAPPLVDVGVDTDTWRRTYADSSGLWEVDFSVPATGWFGEPNLHDFGLGSVATASAGDGEGGCTQVDAEVHDFEDDNSTTFEWDITWLYQEGITKGCNPPENTEFCPNAYVTRGQMAAFLVRALGYTDDGGGDLFTDDDGSIFEGAIDKLGTAGVTKGCNPPDNTLFCPNANVTRGQMAAFLRRAMS